jgi:phage terminase large subunit
MKIFIYVPKLKPDITDTVFIHTSYQDNLKNLSEQSINNYKQYEHSKPEHYWNMIRGLVPEVVRGKIYSNWNVIDVLPHEARLERYGLDFGYSNDPTTIVGIYKYNGGFILDEVCFRTGMSNGEISDTLKTIEKALVIADSAEPKSVDEIRGYGVNILPAEKGPGSVNQGIQFVKSQKISVTRRSVNIIKEYENYAWYEDKDGNTLNEPRDMYNHTMDAIRYGFSSIKPKDDDRKAVMDAKMARVRANSNLNSTK